MKGNKETFQGAVYWRSDTRKPEEIFNTGFKVRSPTNEQNWWKRSIRSSFGEIMPPDAEITACVCMSSSFNGAASFPFDETKETYIYAIALPEAQKITQSHELVQQTQISTKDTVIDLHSHQTEKVRIILENHQQEYTKNPNMALVTSMPLCAYEAMAYEVKPENIIAAAKLTRSNPKKQFLKIQMHGQNVCLETAFYEFQLDPKIIINSNFQGVQSLPGVDNNQQTDIQFDYSENKQSAMKLFATASNSKKLNSSHVLDSLGGKTFASPTKPCFFRDEKSALLIQDPRTDSCLLQQEGKKSEEKMNANENRPL